MKIYCWQRNDTDGLELSNLTKSYRYANVITAFGSKDEAMAYFKRNKDLVDLKYFNLIEFNSGSDVDVDINEYIERMNKEKLMAKEKMKHEKKRAKIERQQKIDKNQKIKEQAFDKYQREQEEHEKYYYLHEKEFDDMGITLEGFINENYPTIETARTWK